MFRRAFAAGLGLAVLVAGGASAATLTIAQAPPGQQAPQQQQPLVLVPEQPIDFSGGQGAAPLQGLPDLSRLRLVLNPDRTISLVTSDGQTISARPQVDQQKRTITAVFDLGSGTNLQATVTLGDQPPARTDFVLTDGTGRRLTAFASLVPEQAGRQQAPAQGPAPGQGQVAPEAVPDTAPGPVSGPSGGGSY